MEINCSMVSTAGGHVDVVVWPPVADIPQWFPRLCNAGTGWLETFSEIKHYTNVLVPEG